MLTLERAVLRQEGFTLTADFTVPAGAQVAVMGPSGAGKSTLLALIAGFLAPTAGRVLWDGHDLAAVPPGARPLSILFQDNNLFPHLDVAANVGLGLRPDLRLDAAQRARVASVLARVGLAGHAARRPAQLSGGQAGRVALARALVRDRPLLLLDEPFAALGPGLRAEMLALVAEVTQTAGMTLVMVSHDPADAWQLDGALVAVEDGRCAPPVPARAFLRAPPADFAAYLGPAWRGPTE